MSTTTTASWLSDFVRRAMLAALALGLTACPPDVPVGPDLVEYSCFCFERASAVTLPLQAWICSDLDDAEKLEEDAQAQCDRKETIGFRVEKIEACSPNTTFFPVGRCPDGSSPHAGGDFGQASWAGSGLFDIDGERIDRFGVSPDTLRVRATHRGATLELAHLEAVVDEFGFSADDGSHTVQNLRLYLATPFSVPIDEDGLFDIPEGVGDFLTSAVLDGTPVAFRGTSRGIDGFYSEEQGLLAFTGVLEGDNGGLTILVSTLLEPVNRPPRAVAGEVQHIECSASDLTGAASLSSEGSFDLDGEDDIERHTWVVDPDAAEPTTVLGATASVALSLGTHVLGLVVTDRSGSFGEDVVLVDVADSLGPTLSISEPAAIQYPHSALLSLDFSASDACTGVATVEARLDGEPTLGGAPLASGRTLDLLTELSLGRHEFSLAGRDTIGNESATSVVFEVVVTPESLASAVRRFLGTGEISRGGVANALLSQIAAGASGLDRSDCREAVKIFRAFIRTVQHQVDISIAPPAATILTSDASALTAHCESAG